MPLIWSQSEFLEPHRWIWPIIRDSILQTNKELKSNRYTVNDIKRTQCNDISGVFIFRWENGGRVVYSATCRAEEQKEQNGILTEDQTILHN